MNLILLEPGEVDGDGRAVLEDGRARHIRRVLRLREGDQLRVGQIDGPVGQGTVEERNSSRVVLRCRFADAHAPRPPVDLLLALPRPKVLKRLYSPLAQLGIDRLMLTNAEKVERMYFDTHVLDPDFQRSRLIEGLQQASDTRLPRVSVHRRLKVLLEDELDGLCPDGLRLWADPSGSQDIRSTVTDHSHRRVLLAVGPEGGWSPFEHSLFLVAGFHGVSAGPRILRSDVACVALVSLVSDALRGCGTTKET